MNITKDTLISCINDATRTIKILVPSKEYYRRPGDADTEELEFIDPYALIRILNDLEGS